MTNRLLLAVFLLWSIASQAFADLLPPAGDPQPRPEPKVAQPDEWWSEETAGLLGGCVGGSVGLLGAAYGILTGLGIAPRLMLSVTLVLAGAGAAILLAGLVAVITAQPYHVTLLPLVIGGVLTPVMAINYPILKRRCEQLEAQR